MSNSRRVCIPITIDTSAAIERGFRAPFDGHIVSVGYAVNVAITAASTALTCEIDGTAVTGAGATIPTTDAVGRTRVSFPTAAQTFRKGQYVSLVGDGGGDAGNVTALFDLEQA